MTTTGVTRGASAFPPFCRSFRSQPGPPHGLHRPRPPQYQWSLDTRTCRESTIILRKARFNPFRSERAADSERDSGYLPSVQVPMPRHAPHPPDLMAPVNPHRRGDCTFSFGVSKIQGIVRHADRKGSSVPNDRLVPLASPGTCARDVMHVPRVASAGFEGLLKSLLFEYHSKGNSYCRVSLASSREGDVVIGLRRDWLQLHADLLRLTLPPLTSFPIEH